MMKRSTACAYLDLTAAELEREIVAGRLPGPIMLGNGLHWSQADIDAHLERLSENDSHAADDWRQRVKLYQS
ncbi:hypothetical protein [Sphingobium sp. YR657]|uniref:hypothetical protein n=1 Tax=Sphingobium sp. YR657 TaxID=1884366 RepID=UPI003137E38A